MLHTGPFPLALRTALSVRGLPLQRVQHHLAHRGVKVGVTSLSYRKQGARRPQRAESLRAVEALEEVLRLPGDSLLRLLRAGDARADAERPAARSYRSLMKAAGRWSGCSTRWGRLPTADCTRWGTRSGYGSGPAGRCSAGTRSMSYGRTVTGSTATSPCTAAIRAAILRG